MDMKQYDFDKAKIYMNDKEVGFMLRDVELQNKKAIVYEKLAEQIQAAEKGMAEIVAIFSDRFGALVSDYQKGTQADRVAASQNNVDFRRSVLGRGGRKKLKAWES
jgi:hypothetical protein